MMVDGEPEIDITKDDWRAIFYTLQMMFIEMKKQAKNNLYVLGGDIGSNPRE